MVYKKRVYKKRPVNGRIRAQQIGSKAGSMAYSAYKLASKVAKMVNAEEKFYETGLSAFAVDYVGVLTVLNGMAQGDTDSTRDGDSIKCKHLSLKGYIDAGATTCTVFRIIVFEDKQNQVSAVTDFMTLSGASTAPNGFKIYDKRFRTKVLLDKTYSFSDTGPNSGHFEFEIPLGHHTQFDAGTTTINTGAYKYIMISNRAPASAEPIVSVHSRLTYIDN